MRIGNGAVLLLSGLLFAGCLQENPGVRAPKFLEAGKSYTFAIPIAGEVRVKVLEIDREAGWVRVEGERVRLNSWINLNHVIIIEPFASK